MELRQLRYFVAVAEEGNISRAASKIFLTQSALSRQIKSLEEEIGQCLLERQAHSIRLTPIGETFLEEARALLVHADQVLDRVRQTSSGLRVRVGYAPSLAAGILSSAVANFTQTHPQARVEMFDLSTKEMLAGLEGDKLDVILTVKPERELRGFAWTPLIQANWQLAVHHSHPLAGKKSVTPAEIAAEPLLAFCQRDYPEYWEFITNLMKGANLRPKVVGEYDGVDSLMAAVDSGQGAALVITHSPRLIPENVRVRPVQTSSKPICIAVGHRMDIAANKPLAVFVEELRRAAVAFSKS